MRKPIAVLTAVGVANLGWDACAKAFNPDHEDKSDPGFAVVQPSTISYTTTTIQNALSGDPIEVAKLFELLRISRST
jgi:hypothetical protein